MSNILSGIRYSGELLQEVSLAKFNTWHVGGKAEYVFKPKDINDLQDFIKQLYEVDKTIDITWLGLGSNVLIRDGGIRGIVILTNSSSSNDLNQLSIDPKSKVVTAGAGVPCAKLAKFLADNNFPQGAFWAGIPGTVGGALAMNAGCYGAETWDFVESVDVLDRLGMTRELNKNDFNIEYRNIENKTQKIGRDLWFIKTKLLLSVNNDLSGRQEIKNLLQKRSSSQPIGLFSGGSVFKNPKGDYSARLIEAAGLKGYKIGGAQISEKHANFIINDKTATADNIEELIYYAQKIVFEKFSIKLEPEVKMLGIKL